MMQDNTPGLDGTRVTLTAPTAGRRLGSAVGHISSAVEQIRSHYPVVVVGSGYGGSIAASRLARAGQRVCLLERGRELRPGEFPTTVSQALEQFQVSGPDGHVGSPLGLYDLRVNRGMSVFVGCGLGGTSLVNANVALTAEPRVFHTWTPRGASTRLHCSRERWRYAS